MKDGENLISSKKKTRVCTKKSLNSRKRDQLQPIYKEYKT